MSGDTAAAAGRRGPRPRFTRRDVLAAALRVIDAAPPNAFTMRSVAEELGVGVMTLYGYVRSKEEILEGITALVFADTYRAATSAAGWDEQLRAEVRGINDIGSQHPNFVSLLLAQRSPAPAMFHLRERMLAALTDAGFTESAALYSLGVLCNYALGFAAAQAGASPLDLPERLRELPETEFPHLSGLAERYGAHLSSDAFEFGLELLITGLQAALRQDMDQRRPPKH